jgi:hypothetical protein
MHTNQVLNSELYKDFSRFSWYFNGNPITAMHGRDESTASRYKGANASEVLISVNDKTGLGKRTMMISVKSAFLYHK